MKLGAVILVAPLGNIKKLHAFSLLRVVHLLSAEILYDRQRDYWINGLAAATVARMISEGRGVQSGLHFLADAADPLAFMAELQGAGIGLTECFAAGGADTGIR